jgi:hypothetical protein
VSGKTRRHSLDLAEDERLLSVMRDMLQMRKAGVQRDAETLEARCATKALRKQVQAAAGCGRLLRQRLAGAFECAAALGLDALEDFIRHRPWLTRAKPAGRPSKIARYCLRLILFVTVLLICL